MHKTEDSLVCIRNDRQHPQKQATNIAQNASRARCQALLQASCIAPLNHLRREFILAINPLTGHKQSLLAAVHSLDDAERGTQTLSNLIALRLSYLAIKNILE
jgi:hypothetical protein